MDVAPTVLALLGLPPTNMDGVVLADALKWPTKKQVHRHDLLAPKLAAYQQAILARSLADIQGQTGIIGPPPKIPRV
jgi:arylsulfatase A-like enzyme